MQKIKYFYCLITQSYFRALKDARLNSTHYVVMKINNKKELKSMTEETAGNIDYRDFLKMYDYCTSEPYCFMTIDTRLNTPMRFRNNFMESPYKND